MTVGDSICRFKVFEFLSLIMGDSIGHVFKGRGGGYIYIYMQGEICIYACIVCM